MAVYGALDRSLQWLPVAGGFKEHEIKHWDPTKKHNLQNAWTNE